MQRQFELPAIRREDVRGVQVLREFTRGRELRQQRFGELGRRVHGARGYTIGWLGTASPPMAGTASESMQGPSGTSSGTKASSVMRSEEHTSELQSQSNLV